LPPPPPAPTAYKLSSALTIAVDAPGVTMSNDTVVVPMYNVVRNVATVQAAPVIFFEKNSTRPLTSSSPAQALQQNILTALRQYTRSHPTSRITIIGASAADELPLIARERVLWTTRQLGLDPNRIEVRTIALPKPKYPTLEDEQRYVRFEIDGVGKVIKVDSIVSVLQSSAGIDVRVVHVLECEAGPCQQQILTTTNGRNIELQGTDVFRSFRINPSDLPDTTATVEIVANASATDRTGQKAQSSKQLFVRATVARAIDSVSNLTPIADVGGEKSDVVVLGYFGFDGDEFTSTNADGIQRVREAIASGRSVTLIPQTDDLGSEAHNAQLRSRRAQAGRLLLGADASSVTIDLKVSSEDVGDSPMRRMARRSVLARIR
ncbi:MAG: hypothetical protein SGJ05_04650, partial [bacterium]|nr:hypothetical protein [bacterium]